MPTENLVQIFLTSVVQGITEFLPISSTGHISFLILYLQLYITFGMT